MTHLIQPDGTVLTGLFEKPITHIKYLDYDLRTPMGLKLPKLYKRLRFNQFAFFGVLGPEVMAGMAVVDLKFAANGFFYIHDRKEGKTRETKALALPGKNIFIRPTPDVIDARFQSGPLEIQIQDRSIRARGRDMDLTAELPNSLPPSLSICTRAGYRGWVYTRKITPIPIKGELNIAGKKILIDSPAYMGLIDWTAGYMRRETFWNWAAIAGTLPDGRSLGLNLACGVNETSHTENAFWIDHQMTKVDSAAFHFNSRNPFDPWRIVSADGKVNLDFTPEANRAEKIQAGLIATSFTQMMGVFDGQLKTDDGEVITFSGMPGWTEDHYAKW